MSELIHSEEDRALILALKAFANNPFKRVLSVTKNPNFSKSFLELNNLGNWIEYTKAHSPYEFNTLSIDPSEYTDSRWFAMIEHLPMHQSSLKAYNFDKSYLKMAKIWANNSYCERRKVGAIIVKDRMMISDGYNGMPSGMDNVCELSDGTTDPRVLHAEANAITKLAKSTNSGKDATLYVTTSPCLECAKLIIQTEISSVIFSDLYRDVSGVKLLLDSGVSVRYLLI